jgi:hypothetical protein
VASTEIINNNGEECSGKMKEVHDDEKFPLPQGEGNAGVTAA